MFDRAYKDLAFVPRWSIVRKLRNQSVSEHSWLVVMYTADICQFLGLDDGTTLRAVLHAAWHDVDELFSGDFPGPNKREMVSDIGAWKRGLERFMHRIFGHREEVDFGSDPLIKAIVKLADWIESASEAACEVQMGNQNMLVHFIHDTAQIADAARTVCLAADQEHRFEELCKLVTAALDEARYGQSPGPVMAEEMQPAKLIREQMRR